MSTKPRLLIAVVVLAAAGGGFYAFRHVNTPVEAAPPIESPKGDAQPRVGALGRIEPSSEIISLGGPADQLLVRLLVKEGDKVTKGQALGYFLDYAKNVADRQRIAAKLEEAKNMLTATTDAGEAAIHEAEVKLKQTETTYPMRISTEESKIRGMEIALANAHDILDSRRKLFATRNQSRRDVDDQQALVKQNEHDLAGERMNLERLRSDMPIETQLAKASLTRAKADLTRSTAGIGIESLRGELAVADARVREATLVAPLDGTILKIYTRPGARVGDTPILTMGDTSEMHAVAEVYETDIRRVRLGQTATITSPALAGPLKGEVVKIGRIIFKNDVLGVDPAAKIDARVVEVRVRIDKSAEVAALTNLTVNVVIDTDDGKASGAAPPGPEKGAK